MTREDNCGVKASARYARTERTVPTTTYLKEIVKVSVMGITKLGSATVALVLVCLLAGCGGSSSSTTASADGPGSGGTSSTSGGDSSSAGAGHAAAIAAVNALLTRPTSIGITTPVKGGAPKGKKIVYLQCGVPDCALIGNAMQAATSQVGWSLSRVTTGTAPETIAAAWQEALRQHPDGIVMTGGYPVAYYRSEIAQANNEKIPVVALAQSDQGAPFNLVIGSGQVQGTIAGQIAAQWIGSKITSGSVLAVNIPGIGAVQSEISAFKSALPKYCPQCSVEVLSVPPSSVGTSAATLIANYLQGHREIKYMYLSSSDLSIGLQAAMASVGLQPVPTVGAVEDATTLDELQNHQGGLEAIIYWVDIEAAYRAVDGLARYFRGQSLAPDTDATLKQWLVTASNITGERPLPAVKDYIQQFDSLWGVK
jgi:ribose transport system substrate-binding protein